MPHFKDEILNRLAEKGNVAQFVSFRPSGSKLRPGFSRIRGFTPNHPFVTAEDAVDQLLRNSAIRSVNVRSYEPESPRSKEFVYGLKNRDEVIATLHRLALSDLHLIVNETIDVADGGVSGVIQNDVVEFAPDDTPRCVEKPGVASLPFGVAIKMLQTVYGRSFDLTWEPSMRTEFSIHPMPCGFKKTHTLLWEQEHGVPGSPKPTHFWPNRFSRHIGDKAYGLLVAHLLGARVPRTLVIGRRVAPFSFGAETGGGIVWTRTCPREPQPGLYSTKKGWVDPFALLAKEDPVGTVLASVLAQAGVSAQHSGAGLLGSDGVLIVEGREGDGDEFMLGLAGPQLLPTRVLSDVNGVFETLSSQIGPIRFEWVHDGESAWIVQLHRGRTATDSEFIVPGNPDRWVRFDVAQGLDRLRILLAELPHDAGIVIAGQVGVTSHVADLLRKAHRPSKLEQRTLL